MLTIIDRVPDGFLSIRAADLKNILAGPTLIHIPGTRPEPLFVSILLHGNEDVGLLAVQRVLLEHKSRPLPRSMSIFVGNVDAAAANARRLPGQPDYNRVWPGGLDTTSTVAAMMADIVAMMRERQVFASIDLHNNTGHNPHYSCVTKMGNQHLQLASLFGPTGVYFRRPLGVQTRAFAELCPAVTCECGKVGQEAGVEHAATFISACLHLSEIPDRSVPVGDLHIFHTVATMKVPDNVTFGFGSDHVDIDFVSDLDLLNFTELKPGAILGRHKLGSAPPIYVEDEDGRPMTTSFVDASNGLIRMTRHVMPSMFTCDPTIIRLDCLGYLMERFPLPA